jgi:hypothetical protein
VIKTLEAQVGHFLPGRKVLGEPGHLGARTRPIGEISAVVFFAKILQLHQLISVILRVDSLGLWKIIS